MNLNIWSENILYQICRFSRKETQESKICLHIILQKLELILMPQISEEQTGVLFQKKRPESKSSTHDNVYKKYENSMSPLFLGFVENR